MNLRHMSKFLLFAVLCGSQPAFAQSPQSVTFAGSDGVTLQGFLYAPDKPGRHPAVVALHGCSGLTGKDGAPSERHHDWGRRLSGEGFIVLFPDSFASRGLGPQCKNSEREVHPSGERVDDAKAALRFLASRKDVKPDAISLLGWSNGGSSTLYAVQPKNAGAVRNRLPDTIEAGARIASDMAEPPTGMKL